MRTPSEQPFVVRFDRADGMGVARFANVGHINEPIRERNWLPLHSLHRVITAGTYHYWNLCFFRSEHGPVPHPSIPMVKCVCSVAAGNYQQALPLPCGSLSRARNAFSPTVGLRQFRLFATNSLRQSKPER
jgi:hypothetical protein